MKNSEFQKKYNKIISEQKLYTSEIIPHSLTKKSIFTQGILDLFGGNKEQAKAAKSDTMKNLQKAVPTPEKEQPSALTKGLSMIGKLATDISDGATGLVKKVPVVGNVVGSTVQTLNPVSKNFLKVDKIPQSFVKDFDNVKDTVKQFVKSDQGKKVAEQYHIDPQNEEQLRALYGRYEQMRWIYQMQQNPSVVWPVEQTVQKVHPVQKKESDDKAAKKAAAKEYRLKCKNNGLKFIWKLAKKDELKKGVYTIQI